MAMQALGTPAEAAAWLAARVQGQLRTDSRDVLPGDGFIAWPGQATDGRRFVAAALAAGASACIVEASGAAAFDLDDARVATLPGLRQSAGAVADRFYAHPAGQLQVLAVTGTNGKTSCAWWLAQALTHLGQRCGVVGTLGVGEPGAVQATGLTTPDAVALHAALRRFADAGFAACALEASSIGLMEHRLAALKIDVALFTNLTRDHLDYHGDMAAYGAAKRSLFAWPGLRAAVVNVDDEYGAALAAEIARDAQPGKPALWTVAVQACARLRARHLRYEAGNLVFEVAEGESQATVHSGLVGDFNASNLLLVTAGLRALGVSLADAAAAACALTPVPGRLQRVVGADGHDADDAIEVVVDYAHTPDALDHALQALRPLASARGGRLWCVFGCGGNRDATKRPLMGAIAARRADRVIITSDNPRHEASALILAQILAGVTGHDEVEVIEDRREAIREAVAQAAPGDVLLLAGKGHEDYQDVGGVKRPFCDIDEARAALALRAGRGAAPRAGGES